LDASDSGGSGRRRGGGESPEARRRRGSAEFLPSFAALQAAVRKACARQTEWQAKLGAGIRAALDFAAGDPAAAHALTIEARRQGSRTENRQKELVEHFAAEIAAVAPSDQRFEVSTNTGIVEAAAQIVRGHLLAGKAEELPTLAPELINLALLPYCGMAEAQRWAESFSLSASSPGT
jgi:hypothetical protein